MLVEEKMLVLQKEEQEGVEQRLEEVVVGERDHLMEGEVEGVRQERVVVVGQEMFEQDLLREEQQVNCFPPFLLPHSLSVSKR